MITKPHISFTINLVYSVGMLISATFITWWLLSTIDFLYPTFYQWLDIGATINEFGSKNRFKDGFETTNYQQHISYFSQIVTAINNDGQGLAAISYPYQGVQVKLLRDAEILHLQDVGRLMSVLFSAGKVTLLLTFVILMIKVKDSSSLPSIKKQLIQLSMFIISLSVVFAIIGFQSVFYWLHEVIFPQDNEWFFYYQDSLMTTMMKAPILFAPISLLLVLSTCLIFYILNVLITMLYQRLVKFTKLNG